MIYLGIDLGTTFSLVSYVNERGVPALFPDFHDVSEFRTSSVIHVGEEGFLVGDPLESLLEDDPSIPHTRFIKLKMGEHEPVITDHRNRQWLPESLSALVLRKMMRDVESFSPDEVGGVVVTVPANFNDAQCQSTKVAAMMAGLPNPQLIEEPVAAATFYGFAEGRTDQTLFVYDLGGGTFDSTVLQSSPDGLYALATEGISHIGGKGVDEVIMNQVAQSYKNQYGSDLLADPATEAQLRRFATETKLKLSKPGAKQVRKTLLLNGQTLDYLLTRDHFEQLIEPLIDETLDTCETCLNNAGLDWCMVDKVLLTGGSSLLPLVQKKLVLRSQITTSQIVCKQPHQAVAFGAALIAQQQFAPDASEIGSHLQKISAYDLGIRARDPKNKEPMVEVLVKKNAPIPAEASMTFYTNREDQTRMIIEVVQQRAPDEDELSLGYFEFGPIETPRKNYPVEITLAYDMEGLVRVTAKDPTTGKKMGQIMDEQGKTFNHALIEQQDWVRAAFINE